MTPLTLIIIETVAIFLLTRIEKKNLDKSRNPVYGVIGGVLLMAIFVTVAWAAFYYN